MMQGLNPIESAVAELIRGEDGVERRQAVVRKGLNYFNRLGMYPIYECVDWGNTLDL